MAKTYNTFTNVSTGDVLTATNFNNVLTNIAGYRVPSYCRAKRSADTSGIATNTDIAWDAEDYDTDTMHDNVTNNARITIGTSGIYMVTMGAYVTFGGTATQISYLIFKDGTQWVEQDWFGSRGGDFTGAVTGLMALDAGSYITSRIAYVGATASSLIVKASNMSYFSAIWVGQTA